MELEQMASPGALCAAIIRFGSGAAHAGLGATTPGQPRLGDDYFIIAPVTTRIPVAELQAYLDSLKSPVMLCQTTQRGVLAMIPLDEAGGHRKAALKHEFANQRAHVEEIAAKFELKPDARVLLEFDEEMCMFPLSIMARWSSLFITTVGWNLSREADATRADLRLNLVRSDRQQSTGSCGLG